VHGCPTVAAPLTSLPEVGGGAARYADPRDVEAWAAAMRALTEPAEANRLRALGRARAGLFSWEEAASRYRAIYRELS
jgi:glycosyltransferase involved in cell wall biosynthesis